MSWNQKKTVLTLLMVLVGLNEYYGCSAFSPSFQKRNRSSRVGIQMSSSLDVEHELLQKLPAALEEYESENAVTDWKACVDLLETYNVEEAEWMLAQAFGWVRWMKVTSTIARKYMAKPTIPSVSELQSAIDWISSNNLSVAHVIVTAPESYLKEPQKNFQKASSCAPRNYRGEAFLDLLQTDAKAIQNTYNCDGDSCASECGSCWVTYQRNNPQWS